jgi:hypothetical protein
MMALFLGMAPKAMALFGGVYNGDGTYFGPSGITTGNCAFGNSGAHTQQWAAGATFVALNAPQWAGSQYCGLCIEFKGDGAGLGGTPPPTTWTRGIVCDQCPECKSGDLDFATAGDGRWAISWRAVPCAVDSPFMYWTTGTSHAHYSKIQISNSK